MTVINKWIKGLSSLSCQSHPLEVIILRPWGLVLQLCCTTLTGWFLCPRPLHDLHFNSHAQWRHLVANSRNVYLCVHQDCLNVNFALKFADKFFNWSADCEDWVACIQEFRAFQNSTGKNITFDRLITVVLRVCWSLIPFFFCIQWGPPGGGQCSLHVQHFPESHRQRWLHHDPGGNQRSRRENGFRLGQSRGEQ